jgi:hypothetical protein
MANSYLNKTFGTPTNSATWTLSAWIKRSSLSGSQKFFTAGSSDTDRTEMYFASGGNFSIYSNLSGTVATLNSTRLFRDTSAWYHFVVQNNNGTVTLYVNNQTVSLSSSTLGTNKINIASTAHYIGRQVSDTTQNFDGYMSHVSFVDGSVVAPTVFGETDSTSGIWKFKSPSGVTWGTNGFHLKFENSGALGTDSSGNTNTFTVNGNLKQALDTPSNVYVNLNPLGFQDAANSQLSNGNTTFSSATNGDHNLTIGNLAVDTGKWYWEVKLAGTVNDYSYIGIRDIDSNPLKNQYVGTVTGGIALRDDGYLNIDGSFPSQFSGISYTAGDIISVGLDLDNNKIYWYENGTLINSGGTTITNRLYAPCVSMVGNNGISNFNFGNGFFGTTAISSAGSNGNGSLFEYDVPSGYYALNTKNINTYG